MSLYGRFVDGKEKAFRDEFVKPLLNRLGFHGVDHQHGSQEFGKDFVFSEHHRLAGVRHYAAVCKHIETISQSKDLDDLLRQIREAFTVPFKRSDSPRDCYVAAVFVFNDGAISANARTVLAAALTKEHYGDNVHFFDGERLQAVNEFSAYHEERNARARLLGLVEQMEINDRILVKLESAALDEQKGELRMDTRELMLHATEDFLSAPLDDSDALKDKLWMYWYDGSGIHSIRQRLFLSPNMNPADRRASLSLLKQMVTRLRNSGIPITAEVEKLLQRYRPIA